MVNLRTPYEENMIIRLKPHSYWVHWLQLIGKLMLLSQNHHYVVAPKTTTYILENTLQYRVPRPSQRAPEAWPWGNMSSAWCASSTCRVHLCLHLKLMMALTLHNTKSNWTLGAIQVIRFSLFISLFSSILRYPSRSAEVDLCWQTVRRWPHTVWLQHPEGINPPSGAEASRWSQEAQEEELHHTKEEQA